MTDRKPGQRVRVVDIGRARGWNAVKHLVGSVGVVTGATGEGFPLVHFAEDSHGGFTYFFYDNELEAVE